METNKKIININNFMKEFLSSKDKKAIILKYQNFINQIKPIDLFNLNMYKDNNDYSIEEIKENANKFVNIFHVPLSKHAFTSHYHPFFKAIIQENKHIKAHLNNMKKLLTKENIVNNLPVIKIELEKLNELEKKWLKKENIIFPRIEKNIPSHKPLDIMWSLHDDVRNELKLLLSNFTSKKIDINTFNKKIGSFYYLLFGIIQKEELILYPVASEILTNEILDEMYQESFLYGYTFLNLDRPVIKQTDINNEFIFSPINGKLNFNQLNLLFNNLPIDITYVDEFDKVLFYNDTKTRHFPRNPSVIGRLVENCHPPKSINIVKKIIQSFKNNEKNSAQFYINYKDKFISITYYAIRDEHNNYRGILEVSQDITNLKNINKEKRLLDW
ncbi:MAG: PAS domain-containing protein [Bacilli bacterium]|jgi:DUF438 domain-containing protein|nr:PAS domain-containing protein [Bacilli bacterium]MDY0363294.1 PAS domain-containing protein [Bacilli bacterium]